MQTYNHPFHLVTMSPWPLFTSISLMNVLLSMSYWFHSKSYIYLLINLIILLLNLFQWWRDVIRESTFQGSHTYFVYMNMRLGMLLFIISEIFFFIGFFWSYFHMSLSPSIEIGSIWPPKGIKIFNPFDIPLLNTMILISSGFFVTWSHYSLINDDMKESLLSLLITILLGMFFSLMQLIEYKESYFIISDSVYGSLFFMLTGFHGLHVLIGTIFLLICFFRMKKDHFSSIRHFGFEAAIWYWHFVDVIWLILYMLIYCWIWIF